MKVNINAESVNTFLAISQIFCLKTVSSSEKETENCYAELFLKVFEVFIVCKKTEERIYFMPLSGSCSLCCHGRCWTLSCMSCQSSSCREGSSYMCVQETCSSSSSPVVPSWLAQEEASGYLAGEGNILTGNTGQARFSADKATKWLSLKRGRCACFCHLL